VKTGSNLLTFWVVMSVPSSGLKRMRGASAKDLYMG